MVPPLHVHMAGLGRPTGGPWAAHGPAHGPAHGRPWPAMAGHGPAHGPAKAGHMHVQWGHHCVPALMETNEKLPYGAYNKFHMDTIWAPHGTQDDPQVTCDVT